MTKKLMLLATMAMVLAGFAAAMAHGEAGIQWKDKGANLTADGAIGLEGKMKYNNATLGGEECSVIATATLTKGTSTVDITSFRVANTSACVLSGLLGLECEALIGHEYTSEGSALSSTHPWKGTGTKTGAIDLSGVVFHTTLKAKAGHTKCPSKLTLESTTTAFPVLTLDSITAATKATLSGSFTTTGPLGEDLGVISYSGTLNITAPNSGTYGIG